MSEENDEFIELLKKVETLPSGLQPEVFMHAFSELDIENMSPIEIIEGNIQMFELLPKFYEGEILLEELVLLMSPSTKNMMTQIYRKILDGNKE